jgi:hypothetical protein
MRRVAIFSGVWIVLLSIAARAAYYKEDDKDKDRFAPGAASSYKGSQTMEKITIAAVPFTGEEQVRSAFGKVDPNKYGVLPVLVILENGTGKALRLTLQADFVADGKHVDATPPSDVTFIGGSGKAPRMPGTSPYPFPRKEKKGPLNIWEIEGRAFTAKLLPLGEKVFGFFYFQTDYKPGSTLYLTGISDASTGKEYLYFEVPLEKQP